METRQLEMEFSDQVREGVVAESAEAVEAAPQALNKEEYGQRTRRTFQACAAWMDESVSAHGFGADSLGVYDGRDCETSGTLADAERVKALVEDWAMASGLAIAIEDASITIEDQSIDEHCPVVVRSLYLAIAFKNSEWDLEALLPGFPVIAMERDLG